MRLSSSLAICMCVIAGFASGCVSSVSREPGSPSVAYHLSEARKVSQVSISLSPAARDKMKDNLKFDPEALRAHVERALSAYSILDGAQKGKIPSVEIVVTNVRIRSNFSAVMWGVMAGADSIDGDIVIKDAAGNQLDRFGVSTSYALGGLAGGQDNARMDWLYEAFAKQAILELTGANPDEKKT